MTNERWPKEREDELRAFIDAGMTASDIAWRMNLKSRSQVIGKARRMGLHCHGGKTTFWIKERLQELDRLNNSSTGFSRKELADRLGTTERSIHAGLERLRKRQGIRIRRPYKKKPIDPKLIEAKLQPIIEDAPIDAERMTIFDLKPHHCRYILGEVSGKDTVYCGAAVVQKDVSWCAVHYRIAHAPRA